jgi:hypothetical protein
MTTLYGCETHMLMVAEIVIGDNFSTGPAYVLRAKYWVVSWAHTTTLTLEALQKAGVYDHATTMWYDKDETNHTWPNCVLHFTKHEKERHHKMTARAAGFHGANKITPKLKTAPKETPDGNAYGSNEDPAAFKSNNIELYYCWTHGLSRNA